MKKYLSLSLLIFVLNGQNLLAQNTVRDFYNFDIGDVFNYDLRATGDDPTYGYVDYTKTWKEVVDKQVFQDSIVYGFHTIRLKTPIPFTYNWILIEDTVLFKSITDLDSTITYEPNIVPKGFNQSNCNRMYDSIYDSNFDNRLGLYTELNCYGDLHQRLIQGVGLEYEYFFSESASAFYETQLTYYYKAASSNTWGNRMSLSTLLSVPEISTSTKVFPNPVSKLLYIESEREEFNHYEILNSYGQVVGKNSLSNLEQIDFSIYQNGLYFLYLKDESGHSYMKNIVKKD